MSFAALSWKLKIADQICHLFLETGEGPGLLRLHSTYRHDLKIYSSDEGRVQVSTMSAMVSSVANFQVFWNFFWQCRIPSLWNEWFPLRFPFLDGWMGQKENCIKNFVDVRRACPFNRNSMGVLATFADVSCCICKRIA